MEKVVKEYILQNITDFINDKKGLVRKIKDLAYEKGSSISLTEFIERYDVEFLDIYKTTRRVEGKTLKNSFYSLCVEAGVKENFICKDELRLANSIGKVTFINSPRLLKLLIDVMENIESYRDYKFSEAEENLLLMFHYLVWGDSLNQCSMNGIFESFLRLYENRVIFHEILEILKYKIEHIDVAAKGDTAFLNSSLEIHCTYTTDQILTALGKSTGDKKYSFQEGALEVKEKNLDAFFITLNKVEKHYSPSTMYKDYAMNDHLFHWQTQSKIGPDTPTCQRYINHKKDNHKILLFVREYKTQKGFTAPFTYLGTADYVRSYGAKPVNIVWRLHEPLPAVIERAAEKAL